VFSLLARIPPRSVTRRASPRVQAREGALSATSVLDSLQRLSAWFFWWEMKVPWPFSWLRRRPKKPAALGVDLNSYRSEQGLSKMPGVGTVDIRCTKKSKHPASCVLDDAGYDIVPFNSDRSGKIPSSVCPAAALVHPKSAVSITELRLSPNKSPVCVILTEEIDTYSPPKHCRSSR